MSMKFVLSLSLSLSIYLSLSLSSLSLSLSSLSPPPLSLSLSLSDLDVGPSVIVRGIGKTSLHFGMWCRKFIMCVFDECPGLWTICRSWQHTWVVHLSLQADGKVTFEEIVCRPACQDSSFYLFGLILFLDVVVLFLVYVAVNITDWSPSYTPECNFSIRAMILFLDIVALFVKVFYRPVFVLAMFSSDPFQVLICLHFFSYFI